MSHLPSQFHRRSIRLKGYDYSQTGWYFVTLCVQDRVCLFGQVVTTANCIHPQMKLNEYGRIAEYELLKTNEIRSNVEIDSLVIMPNHVHFIIHIITEVGANCIRPILLNRTNAI